MRTPETFENKKYSIIIEVYPQGTIASIVGAPEEIKYQEVIGALEHTKQRYIWDQMSFNKKNADKVNKKLRADRAKRK